MEDSSRKNLEKVCLVSYDKQSETRRERICKTTTRIGVSETYVIVWVLPFLISLFLSDIISISIFVSIFHLRDGRS